MSCCLIEKKNLERLGKKLMKEFYKHVHDDYFLTEFDKLKLKRKYYDENLTKEFLYFYKKQEENGFSILYFHDKRYEDLLEMKNEDLLSKIEDKIKDETLNVDIIYRFLDKMDRELKINKGDDFEIHEGLFFMKNAFINIYEVYHYHCKYLED